MKFLEICDNLFVTHKWLNETAPVKALHFEINFKFDCQGHKIEDYFGHFCPLGDTTWWHKVGYNFKYLENES